MRALSPIILFFEYVGFFWLRMGLSKEAVEEFIKIWQEEYGELLMEREAEGIGTRLLLLFKTIYSKQYENEKPIQNK